MSEVDKITVMVSSMIQDRLGGSRKRRLERKGEDAVKGVLVASAMTDNKRYFQSFSSLRWSRRSEHLLRNGRDRRLPDAGKASNSQT